MPHYFHLFSVAGVEVIQNLNYHSGYLPILKLVIRMHISYFLIFVLVSFSFISGRGSLTRTAYDKYEFRGYITRPLHCRIYPIVPIVIQSIVTFRGRLSSEYQVVGNQRTLLVIVQIILDLGTPSPFKYACRTYFCYEHSLNYINCAQFQFNFHLPLC